MGLVLGAYLDQDVGDGPGGCGELASDWSCLMVLPIRKTSIELVAIQPELGMTGRLLMIIHFLALKVLVRSSY